MSPSEMKIMVTGRQDAPGIREYYKTVINTVELSQALLSSASWS
jgi:hypothetical protein